MNRLFLAVPVRLYHYSYIQNEFSPLIEGRWRNESQLHVTIAFLDKTFQTKELIEKLAGFDWRFEPSELTRFDYFSGSRVFVATTPNPTLQKLYERLEPLLGLQHADIRPHTTLMRVKKIIDADAFAIRLKDAPPEPVGLLEPRIVLYKSKLHPEGATYTALQEWQL